jgi:hypothetical protein
MEEIKFEGMQKLMSSVERAKLVGLIKEPQEINITEKKNILSNGIVLGGFIVLFGAVLYVFINSVIEEKKLKNKNSI